MEIWQRIMSFTEENAAKVHQNQWNLNYLEVVGKRFENNPEIADICKRIPKLKVETHTRYAKPRVESKLALNFKYTPPPKRTKAREKLQNTAVTVKVVAPKVEDSLPTRNCICNCREDLSNGQGTCTINDEDDDDITLDKLLEIINHFDPETSRGVALINLATGYHGNIILDEDTVIKILMMLDSRNDICLEAILLMIHRLSQSCVNSRLLLTHGVMDDLMYLMLMSTNEQIQTQAALCIAKLTEREEYTNLWIETMVISGMEALFDVLANKETSETRLDAVLETVAHIARHEKMSTMLVDFGLENVIELLHCKIKAIKVLTNVLSHNCIMVEKFLDKYGDAVEKVVDILQYGKCHHQQEAARFLATLTFFKPSIDSITSHHATQHILWAMTCSYCRIVREYTSTAFKNIANHSNKDKLLNALSDFTMFDHSCIVSHDSASLTETLARSTMQDNTNKVINSVKNQTTCSTLEKIMVEVFAVLCLCFQTDSLHISGKERAFTNAHGKSSRTDQNSINENYLSSLKVLCNSLVAIESLLSLREKEEAAAKDVGVNVKLAALFIRCGGLQFINQLQFLSTRFQQVNSPSFHTIDPTTLPPKDLISTLKNSRTKLMFQSNKHKTSTAQYPDFGLHRQEVEFIKQSLSFLTALGRVIVPEYDPALEDLKVFEYRRQVVGKKRHLSFRNSALVVKNTLQLGKLSPRVGSIGETTPVNVKRKSSQSTSKKNYRPTASLSVDSVLSGHSRTNVATPPMAMIEPGSSSNCEIVNYIKRSVLNSNVVSHLSSWITCGNYDIQVSVLKTIRYLMHISQVQKQAADNQASVSESQEPWTLRRSTLTAGQRSSSPTKSRSKSSYLGHLCVRHVIQYCGPYLLDLLKPPAGGGLGRMSLMVIHECMVNGEPDSRIKLVKLGSFAQIIDYIRGAEDEPDSQSLALVVLRKLVSSDQSLKQLFFAHGGMSLVMALHEYKQGAVKDQAALTLTALSKGSTLAGKTKSQSKKRHRKTSSADDVWDHVTQKWEGQDRVCKLLKKFNVRY